MVSPQTTNDEAPTRPKKRPSCHASYFSSSYPIYPLTWHTLSINCYPLFQVQLFSVSCDILNLKVGQHKASDDSDDNLVFVWHIDSTPRK